MAKTEEGMGLLGVTVLFVLLQYVASQDANCDFTQNVQVGQTYYVYSPGYPNAYTGARQCRWIGIAPAGYQAVLDCPEISLPASQGCSLDRLLISRSGDPQLSGADVYCGRGSTTAVSTGQRLSVGLITASTTPGGRFSCQLSAKKTTPTPTPCSCGYRKTNRIVGGQETGINEFPMMAGVVDRKLRQIKCGGTIIQKRYIATAAHCVAGRSAQDFAVVVGEHDTTVGDSPATQGINVQQITIHPQYNPSNYDNDIAILLLEKDMVFSDRVGPACLPFKYTNYNFTNSLVTLLGWGTLCFGCPASNTLQKVNVNVLSQSTCQRAQPSLTPRQMCTFAEGKDACQDDSGGPALYTEPSTGLLYLVGIISHGKLCGTQDPGINTRVTALLAWIQSNTPGVTYCVK